MTMRASGTFDVTILPLFAAIIGDDAPLARMSIEKQFHGDLEGTSKGEMLSSGSPATGSAGYVAIEKVTGTLQGREGTFALQHSATMNRGVPSLSVTVIPDSGTGGLAGLSGSVDIIVENKKHSYTFDYSLGEAHG
ncbi:MAG: DUF3224 domain-containing protein [Gemmatimonadaceae bacterium]|nr:DUF3224 domain-containing protein [Gemmatimonadaceae bacterium]